MQVYERPIKLLSFNQAVAKSVPTETYSVVPRYTTLSYCWGHGPLTSLTVEIMNSFLEGFSITSLPKLFQDAIHVARELAVPHIWIDALCIIQQGNDNKDWVTESDHMRSVYGNSFINIAASSAASLYESLFSRANHYSGGFCVRVTLRKRCTVRKFHTPGAH